MAGLEGSPSGSLFLDIQKIPADLRLAQLIRRPSVMLGQAAHRLLINLLCLDGQSCQFHVLDHTGAQRCHRLILRLLRTGGTTPPRHRRIASPARLRPRRHSLWRSRSVQPCSAAANSATLTTSPMALASAAHLALRRKVLKASAIRELGRANNKNSSKTAAQNSDIRSTLQA